MSSADELADRLREAADILQRSGIRPELWPTGFRWTLEEIQRLGASMPAAAPPAAPERAGADRLRRLLGITADQLERVYDLSGAEVGLVVSRSKLPTQKARATKTVALLFAAGRQGASDEEWTPVEAIRDQCRQYGVLDAPNFASAISAAGDSFVLRGRGSQREAKVTRGGFEEAGRLVASMVG